ncbi:hypothetical protein C8J56DRAFT_344139 [Mycena floridula]|nr:hypothetical protein C8J56DRAFT_344139 [Mycena floridula]
MKSEVILATWFPRRFVHLAWTACLFIGGDKGRHQERFWETPEKSFWGRMRGNSGLFVEMETRKTRRETAL